LQIIASTGNADVQLKWLAALSFKTAVLITLFRAGTVESRIRQLVMKLEFVDSLVLAHPFIRGFDQVSYCLTDDEIRAVAQGEISEAIAKRKEEDIKDKAGAGPVYSTTFYIGLMIEPKQRKVFFCGLHCVLD
jgi:poly(A) polymerase